MMSIETISSVVYSKIPFIGPSAAAFKALNGTGADIIVHPNYEIQKHSYLFFSTVNLKVVGYAGFFKKFYQVPYDKK